MTRDNFKFKLLRFFVLFLKTLKLKHMNLCEERKKGKRRTLKIYLYKLKRIQATKKIYL